MSEALVRNPPSTTLRGLGVTLALFILFGLGALGAAIALRDLAEADRRVTRMWIRHRWLVDKVQRVRRLNLARRRAAAAGGFGPGVEAVIGSIGAARRELGLVKRESARAELVHRRGLALEIAGAALFLLGLVLAVWLPRA